MKQRKANRLRDYNYSQPGSYFVTICTKEQKCLFGRVSGSEMQLNALGQIVINTWLEVIESSSNATSDYSIVMPNHFHAILNIENNELEKNLLMSDKESEQRRKTMLLSKVIGRFKMQSAKRINHARNLSGEALWMRSYWDRVIRNEEELMKIREYIQNNPLKWELDKLNPKNK